MEDSFGKVVAIIICAYLMFIAPITYMQKEVDKTKDTYLLNEITCFVEEVQNTGIISKARYDELQNNVSRLASGYNIEIIRTCHGYSQDNEDINYNNIYYFTDEILDKLSSDGSYYLNENDYLKVTIKKNDEPFLFYGGGIKNEAY